MECRRQARRNGTLLRKNATPCSISRSAHLEEAGDVGIDVAPPEDCRGDGGKVVVQKNNVGCLLGGVGACSGHESKRRGSAWGGWGGVGRVVVWLLWAASVAGQLAGGLGLERLAAGAQPHLPAAMAKPTFAARRAGASFVPSPVTATTSLVRLRTPAGHTGGGRQAASAGHAYARSQHVPPERSRNHLAKHGCTTPYL